MCNFLSIFIDLILFRQRVSIGRVELISVFRYLYLDHSFDSDFWEKLLEECRYPVEASGITRKFDQTDLYFI